MKLQNRSEGVKKCNPTILCIVLAPPPPHPCFPLGAVNRHWLGMRLQEGPDDVGEIVVVHGDRSLFTSSWTGRFH